MEEAEQAAQSLRAAWNLGNDPIPNLVELIEERFIKILVVASEDTIDGLAANVCRVGKEPVRIIVIRQSAPGERQRFSLAHELGHMVMEVESNGNEKLNEKAAHRFAGAFLMPAETLRANIGKHRNSIGWSELFALKQLFGASVQAITFRCRDIGIFPPALAEKLFKQFSRRGYRSAPYEPQPLPEEKPGRFDRLCYRALAEDAVSEAKAAELLDISVRELSRRMEPEPVVAG